MFYQNFRTFREQLTESIIDPKRPTLPKVLFDKANIRPDVHKYLTDQINALAKANNLVVKEAVIIGSMVTYRYRDDSDIDITLLVADNTKGRDILTLRQTVNKRYNETKVLPNTQHIINFFLYTDEKEYRKALDLADGIASLTANALVKTPSKDDKFDIERYMDAYRKVVAKIDLLKNDLKDDLLDLKRLKNATAKEIQGLVGLIRKEIGEIEDTANKLIEKNKKIHNDRREIFKRELTSKEIREYGSANALPENVIYKLLERSAYLTFLKKVQQIVGTDLKVSPAEADELAKIV